MNPGFAYVAVTWQIAAEAIVPLNQAAGTGLGFRTQLLLFLDDLMPSVFGKPLLSDKPEVNQIAWHSPRPATDGSILGCDDGDPTLSAQRGSAALSQFPEKEPPRMSNPRLAPREPTVFR